MSTVVGALQTNPYKGLRAFGEADAGEFFGRDRLVNRLAGVLGRDGADGRLLAVVGPSGSGKSSVVRAGLLPALRAGRLPESARWLVTTMVPGAHPFEELEAALHRVATDTAAAQGWADQLGADERGLARAVKKLLPADDADLLLVVDQFEELFTLSDDEAVRRRFLRALAAAVTDPRARLRVVVVMRADFWDRPLRYPEVAALLDRAIVSVGPLAPDELERAIVDPAARAGAEFEPGLVSEIVADVADQPGALPMLQYALTELFDRRVSGLLTLEAYRQLGGVIGALARRAEELFVGATADEQVAARRLFLRLVTLGEGNEDTRRRVVRSELDSDFGADLATDAVTRRFGAARLLSFDRDPATREPTVEVTHESLIRQWPRLRGWLEEDRDGLRIHRHLTDAARSWKQRGLDAAELYRGARLDAAADWAAATGRAADLNPTEAAFLAASQSARDQQQADLRRTNRRLRTLLSGVAVALVVALAAGGLALVQQRRASRSADDAQAAQGRAEAEAARRGELQQSSEVRRLVAESKVAQETSLSVALLLATAAHQRVDSPATKGALQSALLSNPRLLATWYGDAPYNYMDVSADGRLLAASRTDGRVDMWDTATELRRGDPLVVGGPDDTRRAALSPDSRLLVATDGTGEINVWDVATGSRASRLREGTSGANSFAPALFGLSGEVFYGDPAGTVWRTAADGSGSPVAIAEGSPARIDQLKLSTVGGRLAAVDAQFNVTIVRLDGSEAPRRFASGLTGTAVTQVSWSPDGARLAVGVGGQVGGLIDVAAGRLIGTPFTELNSPQLSFTPDGRTLTTAGSGGVLLLRDPLTGAVREGPLQLFDSFSVGTRPSPDGGCLYVAGGRGSIAVVDLVGRTKLGTPIAGPLGQSARYSPDGRLLSFARPDGSANVVDAASGATVADLRPPGAVPAPRGIGNFSTAWDPTSSRLAVGGFAGTITIFDLASGAVVRSFPVPYEPGDTRFAASLGPLAAGYVGLVQWSRDGRFIAAGAMDAVSIFDAATGLRLHRVKGLKDLLLTLEFSPDSRLLAAASFDGTGLLIDPAAGTTVGEPLGTGDFAASMLAWTPDGRAVAVSDTRLGTVRIVDVTTREQIGPTYQPGRAPALYVRFTPDMSTMMSGANTGEVRLTDVATGAPVGDPIRFPSPVGLYSMRPDGKAVATMGLGPLTIWDVDPVSWVEKACRLAGRNLTRDEWAVHLPDDPYRAICPQWPTARP